MRRGVDHTEPRSQAVGGSVGRPGIGRYVPSIRSVVPSIHVAAALEPMANHLGAERMGPQNCALIEIAH